MPTISELLDRAARDETRHRRAIRVERGTRRGVVFAVVFTTCYALVTLLAAWLV